MRLNRVLQITAAVSLALAATIFTISCSDGENGKDGASCNVQNGDNGLDVYCGGNFAGTLTNGPSGQEGQQGAPGTANSENCELGPNVEGSFQVFCRGNFIGTLQGCSLTDIGYETSINCAGSAQISICKGILFDAEDNYCDASGEIQAGLEICGKTSTFAGVHFNPARQYCGYASKAAYDARVPTALSLCGDDTDNKPNEAKAPDWDVADSEWKDEYCSVSVKEIDSTTSFHVRVLEKKLATPVSCDGSLIKLNDGAWKREYCGFADAEAVSKSKVSNACGDGGKPDEEGFGKKYCAILSKKHRFSQISTDYCSEGTEESFVSKPINRTDKDIVTVSDWRGEYCGYASKADYAADAPKKSLLRGVCDDGRGPNSDTWDNGYCTVKFDDAGTPKAPKTTTELVGSASAYCMKDASENYETAGASARINENGWQNQYCGYKNQDAYQRTDGKEGTGPEPIKGVCTDGTKPNEEQWNAEYCQFSSATVSTAKGGVDASSGVSAAYCNVVTLPKTITSSTKGLMNFGSWKNQYCGYSSAANFVKQNTLLATPNAVGTPEVMDKMCEDGTKTNEWKATKPAFWGNEYCKVLTKTGKSTAVGIPAFADRDQPTNTATPVFNIYDVYCLADTTGTGDPSTKPTGYTDGDNYYAKYQASNVAGKNQRINEGTWKDQACVVLSNPGPIVSGAVVPKKADFKIVTDAICYTGGTANAAASFTIWRAEYCQVQYDDRISGNTTKVGITGTAAANGMYTGGTSPDVALSAFCINSAKGSGNGQRADSIANTASTTAYQLNKSSWKGEYCLRGDSTKVTCFAGQEPMGGVLTTNKLLSLQNDKNILNKDTKEKCW